MDLTVIIPCHDDGHFLVEAIGSVVRQETSAAVEIVVVDDHSTEQNTLATLARLPETFPGTRVLRNTGAMGVGPTRNVGIQDARGTWVALLDADDAWLPGSIDLRWQVVRNDPSATWIAGDHYLWQEDGAVLRPGVCAQNEVTREVFAHAFETGRWQRLDQPIHAFLRDSPYGASTMMMKRAPLLEEGAFDHRMFRGEDTHLWLRLALKQNFHFVPAPVALYRLRAMSLSRIEGTPYTCWATGIYQALLRDPRFAAYSRELKRRLLFYHLMNLTHYRRRRDVRRALGEALGALRCEPGNPSNWRRLVTAVLP